MKQNQEREWRQSDREVAFQVTSFPEELQTREGNLRAVGDTEAVTKDICSPHQCRLPASSTLLISALPFISIPLRVSLSLRNPQVLCNSLTRTEAQRFREWKVPSWENTVSPPQKILCWKGVTYPKANSLQRKCQVVCIHFWMLSYTTPQKTQRDSQLKSLTMYPEILQVLPWGARQPPLVTSLWVLIWINTSFHEGASLISASTLHLRKFTCPKATHLSDARYTLVILLYTL